MKKLLTILTSLLLLLACTHYPVAKAEAPSPYEEAIREAFKNPEPQHIETWQRGMLLNYGLRLDKMEVYYKMYSEMDLPNNKNEHLICGALRVVGFGIDIDGRKKRVVQDRFLCHLFKDKIADRAIVIKEIPHVVLEGWKENEVEI